MDARQLFTYRNGVLYWAVARGGRIKAGTEAGTKHKSGYVQIYYKGKSYQRARLVWAMHNGCVPDGFDIDHINAMRHDDRIENLQILSHQDNVLKGGIQTGRSHNTSGFTGVFWNKKLAKWQARIIIKGVQKHLGVFDTAIEANDARKRFEKSIDWILVK